MEALTKFIFFNNFRSVKLDTKWTSYIAWKVSVFGFFMFSIFPHSDWIRRDTNFLVWKFCGNAQFSQSFLKTSTQYLYRSLFFNKLQAYAFNFIKKETLAQAFSCEFEVTVLYTVLLMNRVICKEKPMKIISTLQRQIQISVKYLRWSFFRK